MKNKLFYLLLVTLIVSSCAGGSTQNQSPVANAGADKNVLVSVSATLDSSDSTDPEGDTLTYSWQLIVPPGSAVSLSPADATSPNPSFTIDVTGSYVATLTVNDGNSDSAPDSVTITGVAPNIAFLTTETGTGDLSSWTSAGGQAGLAAGDSVCQTLASGAGLTGTYVAWMSDSNDDAYCRVHGLTGKKGACLPANPTAQAGPWIRTDGTPFAGTIDQMLSSTYQIFSPPKYYEDGTTPSSNIDVIYTGTDNTGVEYGFTCSDWASSSSGLIAALGNPHMTGDSWTMTETGTPCNLSTSRRLLCLQTGAGDPLPDLDLSKKKIFISSETGTGDLSTWTSAGGNNGIAAGDAACQSLAATAGLDNSANFKAWLSDSGSNAIDRFSTDGPWTRVDGIPVADNKLDLTDNLIFTPINVTDQSVYITNNTNANTYTGSNDDGLAATDNCSNWASTATDATLGSAVVQVFWSTWSGVAGCSVARRLFCIED